MKSINIDTIFNSALACSVIAAAAELKLLDNIKEFGSVSIKNFSKKNNLILDSFKEIIYVLEIYDIVKFSNQDIIKGSKLFNEIFEKQSFFIWLVRGYYKMLYELTDIIKEDYRRVPPRNLKFIGLASSQYGKKFIWPYLKKILLGYDLNRIIDLGCGSGYYLSELLKIRKNMIGIGIDTENEILKIAKKIAYKNNLNNRLKFIYFDINDFRNVNRVRKEFKNVDIILSVFTMHEIINDPEERHIKIFKKLKEVFPMARTFVLCDNYEISKNYSSPNVPTYALPLEFVHKIMKKKIPTLGEWKNIFKQSGWKCKKITFTGIPGSAIFELYSI